MTPGSPTRSDTQREEVIAAQVRLLYLNADISAWVTVLAATILVCLQWGTVPNALALGWWSYMILSSGWRLVLARAYRRRPRERSDAGKWRVPIGVASGLAGAGWGGASVLLYSEAHLTNQVFLVFMLGGMMLGAGSLLASRPEAFLSFLLPAGLAASARFLLQGDSLHIAMGTMAGVFTAVTTLMTWRIYRTLESSLELRFENQALVEDLRAAKGETDALNLELERRVQDRTAELQKSTEQLRSEIARREQIEEDLLRARKLESLGVLAGGIAHDFNNFLAVIQGNLELAKTCLSHGEPVEHVIDESQSACRRATLLASQLLTFAKGGAPVRRVVSMKALVTEAAQLVRAGSRVRIDLHLPQDLWCANVDPGQIGQALHNVMLNAREATAEAGVIEVRAENIRTGPGPDVCVRMTIADYGTGIAPEALPRIFDPYYTTKEHGAGLGLATAYAILTKHGGQISVESKLGEGTVFTIDLPATQEVPAQAPQPVTQEPLSQTGAERILVMDDEEALRRLLSGLLTRLGYEVHTANDGAEAIAKYQAAKAAGKGFDAVLLDLTVSGGMGGLEAAMRLKEMDPSAKLVVSSGYSDSAVMSNSSQYGFDAVIPKPWSITQMGGTLRKLLRGDPGQ